MRTPRKLFPRVQSVYRSACQLQILPLSPYNLVLMWDAIGMSQDLYKYKLNALTVSKHLYTHINSIMFILMYQSLAQEELERMEVSIKSVSEGYPR